MPCARSRYHLGGQCVDGRIVCRLESRHVSAATKKEIELVDAVQQTVFGERWHREGDALIVRQGERLCLEVDSHPISTVSVAHQLRDDFRRDLNRKETIPDCIAAKDVGELGSDDGAKSRAEERPHGMLARRAAPEVPPRYENARANCLWPIQRERRDGCPVSIVAP